MSKTNCNAQQILDCTLRDGGFVNDWNFGKQSVKNIYRCIEDANIDIIEIGYLRDNIIYEKGKTVFSHTNDAQWIIERKTSNNHLTVCITDYGCCAQENIAVHTEKDIDGIRLTFKKNDVDAALEYGKQIQDKGYVLFLQPVSILDYKDFEILDLIEKVNKINPYAFAIVDTYGFMQRVDLLRLFYLFDNNLNKEIMIGYHAHNNFQLAYSNATALLELPVQRKRIIDTSIYGMGKSAGNGATELLVQFLNQYYNTSYDLKPLLEAIDAEIAKLSGKSNWGYSFNYFISAAYRCHPEYVKYLINKKSLLVTNLCEILEEIPNGDKTQFSQQLVDKLYFNYLFRNKIADDNAYACLKEKILNKTVLILAPGETLKSEKDKINEFISNNDVFVIGVNVYPLQEYHLDAVFFSNEKRFKFSFSEMKEKIMVMKTSNIAAQNREDLISFNLEKLVDESVNKTENSSILLFNLLVNAGCKACCVAGMDGFNIENRNYFDEHIWLSNDQLMLSQNNDKTILEIEKLKKRLEIKFITKTVFCKE